MLSEFFPFNQLPTPVLEKLNSKAKLLRYRMGQAIVVREQMPTNISIIYEGQVRLLGYDPNTQVPLTLELLQKGEIIGWASLVRGVACETAIASVETICVTLAATEFLGLLDIPVIAQNLYNRPSPIEVFDLLSRELGQRADAEAVLKSSGVENIKELTLKLLKQAAVVNTSKERSLSLDNSQLWFVSGTKEKALAVGTRYSNNQKISNPTRLVGFPQTSLYPAGISSINTNLKQDLSNINSNPESPKQSLKQSNLEIADAPELTKYNESQINGSQTLLNKYPYFHGRGPGDATLACFQMLSQHYNLPFRKDVIRKVINNQIQRTQTLSLQLCGAISELIGLNAQLINISAEAVTKLQPPVMIRWQDTFAIIYEVSEQRLILGVPESGIIQQKPTLFKENWGDEGQVLLLKATKDTPKKRFGISWFIPSLIKYKKVLIEVLVASFFVQIFGLANPLIVQIIIDKVIIQNSIETLNILGLLLVILAAFEAILTSLRTYLFVDTTNRIDLTLGSEIIDHLLRLPLRYFERRPVGELATRANELENIRSFLTGTALTVVLDAIFSLVYIVVMLIYSWVMTLIALGTIPLFALLTVFVSPIIRRQLRDKAERNSETQSYLVEVLSGIQTVKAQNIELRSRWQWQEHYAKYVNAGFQNVITSTTAGATSNFLNQLSGLLILWMGAYLVVQGQLSLGQLIAFRIISGYVTAPLLRLTQLWQNFQETALSLERLADIVDSPPEADESNRNNIPMPSITGKVKFENIAFRFNPNGPLQLKNINLEFTPGTFVGIVGQSGSGKSTLTKLMPRLYDLESGRILMDGYDISKVELYSLRRQIGMVLQDSLLFDGTVMENIALTNPDATTEEIVEAAKIAAAHDFIMSLPNGYNTRVGERGSTLSGGQRQRIAIARTVLQNPNLLILDEATSALDYQSERQVCLNLAEAFNHTTVFFITHRLTTVRNADVIILLDQGAVVEQGTHDELMALRGRYYCLYQQQDSQM